MQRFACSHCRHEVYFENVRCERCGHALGFDPSSLRMVALAPQHDGAFRVEGRLSRRSLKYCGNHTHGVCNWLVADDHGNSLCRACRLNRTIPNLSSAANVAAWAAIEGAKKRLVYSLLRLGLPLDANGGGTTTPLTFDFLAETTTGHFNGVITIDVSEANAVERERQRQWLDRSYRSLLGHFRHESGHYYWMRLVDGTRWLEPFRRMFGDERADYAAALARHHAQGPRPVGPPTTSPPTPARTRPRTGRRPGRTTSTSSTFSTQRWRSVSSTRRGGCCAVLDPGSARSMPIARRACSGSSTSGSRSRSP